MQENLNDRTPVQGTGKGQGQSSRDKDPGAQELK